MRRTTLGSLALALALVGASTATEVQATEAVQVEAEYVQSDGSMIVESHDLADRSVDERSVDERSVDEQSDAVDSARAQLEARMEPGTSAVPARAGGLSGSLRANYAPNVPSNVRTVVSAALAQWDGALVTNVPVIVQVGWECFSNPSLLGFAGPNHLYSSASLPTPNQYPVALANTLAARDLNGGEAEIVMGLNAELAATNTCSYATGEWYISRATAVEANQIDLYSVVLHEIGHGLGFLGSAYQEPIVNQVGAVIGYRSPALDNPRYAFDGLVYSGSTRLLDTADPNSQLTNGNLSIDLGGGHRGKLYAPATFENGSSFSHFDASLSTLAGRLMTPSLGNGQVRREIDAPVLAVLERQGWDVVPRAVVPNALNVTSTSGTATVTWAHNLATYGLPPLSYRVDIMTGNTVVASTTTGGTATSASLPSLPNNANYRAIVTPSDARGWANGAAACFSLGRTPSAPQLVQSAGVGTSRTVTWQPPANAGAGGALAYTVQYRRIGGAWQALGVTSALSIRTPDLPVAPHQFRVAASNSYGPGSWANSTIIGISDSYLRPLPLDGQVSRLYSAYFGRRPDQAGFDFWVGRRASGQSLAAVSSNFATAPEFSSLYGSLDNPAFVDLVYRNVVGRQADPAGRAFWIEYLNRGNSRGALMVGFSESPEYVTRSATSAPTTSSVGTIYRLYLAFFQREPDSAGQSYWVGRLDTGTSLASIANGFVGSDEFQRISGCMSDEQFIQMIYRNVLIREADTAGLTYWTGRLASGMSRGAAMTGFSESPEFIVRTGSIS